MFVIICFYSFFVQNNVHFYITTVLIARYYNFIGIAIGKVPLLRITPHPIAGFL